VRGKKEKEKKGGVKKKKRKKKKTTNTTPSADEAETAKSREPKYCEECHRLFCLHSFAFAFLFSCTHFLIRSWCLRAEKIEVKCV
jgi:hypothetical protein